MAFNECSGVIIPGVEMPKDCHECDSYGISDIFGLKCPCDANKELYSFDKRPDECPLKEIYIKQEDKIMDEKAINIVLNYIAEHLDKSDPEPDFEVYIVWKCKALQNWKYLISTTLYDGMYYELTYNGDKKEWYLDAYKKFQNKVIPD